MPRTIMMTGYFLLVAVLGAATVYFTQPDVALLAMMRPGGMPFSAIILAITAFIYIAALPPLLLLRWQIAVPLSAGVLALVALGPHFVAARAMTDLKLEVQAQDVIAQRPDAPLRVIDFRADHVRGFLGCYTYCIHLLAGGGVQIVRMTDRDGAVLGGFEQGPNGPVQIEGSLPEADATLNIGYFGARDLGQRLSAVERFVLEPQFASQTEIAAGPADQAEGAAILYRQTWLFQMQPLLPAIYAAPTHGLVSGGNDGGLQVMKVKTGDVDGSNVQEEAGFAELGVPLVR